MSDTEQPDADPLDLLHTIATASSESDALLRQVIDNAADAFIGMDGSGLITAWNKAAETLFGWPKEEMIGHSVSATIIPPRYRAAHERGLKRYRETGVAQVLGQKRELSGLTRDGTEIPIELTLWALDGDEHQGFYGFVRDITDRKERERQLEEQAWRDTQTGLANRKRLLELLELHLATHDGPYRNLAILFVDIDRLKNINDSLGHAAGDQVLASVAQLLKDFVRPADLVARLAGDEFVVACPDTGTIEAALSIAERLLETLSEPVHIGDDSVFLTASIGVAMAVESSTAEALLSAADTAMHHAKRAGGGHCEVFDEQLRREITSRLRIENELRVAVSKQQDELCLHFQPIVASDSGNMNAMEALVRWNHPERGLLPPIEFIPVAEDTGLIVPLGEWVLEEACRCARNWVGAGTDNAPLQISVNLSARQLAQSNLIARIRRILSSASIDPSRVQFGIEVTETVVMRDPVAAAWTLHQLKDLGVHLSIDDFGTGYSSLAYLKHFPVDTVKIDRSFVWGLVENPADFAIVHAITHLAHTLNLNVVAEGVETEEQAAALRQANVDSLQGFLYAKPQPSEELERMGWVSARDAKSVEPKPAHRPFAAPHPRRPVGKTTLH